MVSTWPFIRPFVCYHTKDMKRSSLGSGGQRSGGQEVTGREVTGRDVTGRGVKGREVTGREVKGQEVKGQGHVRLKVDFKAWRWCLS